MKGEIERCSTYLHTYLIIILCIEIGRTPLAFLHTELIRSKREEVVATYFLTYACKTLKNGTRELLARIRARHRVQSRCKEKDIFSFHFIACMNNNETATTVLRYFRHYDNNTDTPIGSMTYHAQASASDQPKVQGRLTHNCNSSRKNAWIVEYKIVVYAPTFIFFQSTVIGCQIL